MEKSDESEVDFEPRWEVTILELENHVGRKYKVTRRLPEMTVAETKFFRSKKLAKKQFYNWLK